MKKIVWHVRYPFYLNQQHLLRQSLCSLQNVDCVFDQYGILEQLDPIGSAYVLNQDLSQISLEPPGLSDAELLERCVHKGLDLAWSSNKTPVILYSGGIDSTAVLSACLTHQRLNEMADLGEIIVELTSTSIKELPSFFSKQISGKIKYRLFDFTKSASETETYFGGDHGDVIFGGNTFGKLIDRFGVEFLKSSFPVASVRKFFLELDHSGKLVEAADELSKKCPFQITNGVQYVWWLDVSTSLQRGFLRSFIQSTEDIEINKITDPLYFYKTFSTPAMLNRAAQYFAAYRGVESLYEMKKPLRDYIYRVTGCEEIMSKKKVHSQNFIARKINKNVMYDDGTFDA